MLKIELCFVLQGRKAPESRSPKRWHLHLEVFFGFYIVCILNYDILEFAIVTSAR